jgi:hypothetical protein
MLSIDLFDSTYEKQLHEGAVDNTIEHLLKPLSIRAAEIRTKLRSGRLEPKQIDQLEKEYEDLVQQRLDIMLDRRPQTEQQQSQRTPAKGLLKGKDLVTPQQRVAAATPAKPGMMGAVRDVVGGIKRFVKGEPDQGPTFEQQEGTSPRALGVANFQRLVKANMGHQPTVNFEFIRPEENFKLDQKGLDLISDYYDGLPTDQAKNYFIYRVLPSGDETLTVLKQLGWTPARSVQQELPGMPTQGELPLSEKKKSDSDDLEAGDIKVARELQKLRAQYPGARSDVEAVARAEIDSTERNQQQLSAIRGANEKQDALLKQLVALDQEQGREINSLDSELDRVQSVNNKLQQTLQSMTGTKKVSTAKAEKPSGVINLLPGAPADTKAAVAPEPATAPAPEPVARPAASPAMASITKHLTNKAPPSIRPASAANEPQAQAVAEHGGGIGPRQHWHDLMQETVTDVRPLWADVYRRLAPKIERHRDSFLAGQLYDELENIAELHGAEKEFKQMMNGARNRAHMEYDTNPGGFQNWFWFLPFEDNDVTEGADDIKKKMSKLEALALAANRAGDDAKCKMYQQKIQSLKQKLSQSMSEAVDEKGALKSAQAAAKFIIRNLDDRAALKDYSMHFWSPEKFYQGATMAMRGAGFDEIVKQITQDRPAQFESGVAEGWSDAMVARRTGSPRTPYSVYIKGKKWKDFENEDLARAVANKLKAKFKASGRDPETVTIAPTDMSEEALVEGIKDTASATAVIACLLTGGSLSGCATAPQQTSAQQVLKTGQDLGRTVQTAQRITRAGVEAEVNQEIRNLLRGINRPEELNHSNILRIWRRVNEPKPQQNEAREIVSKEDFVRERDRLLRMIGQETNPANKQILKSAIRQLENRAENEGWITIQNRMVREDSDSGEAVEMAIMRRMLIAHTDLIVEFGLDKVVNAIEEVAYDVGDVDEIGSSDVSGWVRQVRQILGADA